VNYNRTDSEWFQGDREVAKVVKNPLFMGVMEDTAFEIYPEKFQAHTLITGQSGCGKSSLVGRLVEELLLRGAGNVLLFDYNYEFAQFNKTNSKVFKGTWNKSNCAEDDKDAFTTVWKPLSKEFEFRSTRSLQRNNQKLKQIKIKYSDIPLEQKAYLYGIDRDKDAGAYWLIQLISRTKELSSRIKEADGLKKLLSDIERWMEKRWSNGDECLGDVVHQIPQYMNRLDQAKFVNGAERLIGHEIITFDEKDTSPYLDEDFFESLFALKKFCEIDMLNFDQEQETIRKFVVLYALYRIWSIAKERYRKHKDEESPADKNNDLSNLFIVIDEAHNIVPEDNGIDSDLSREVVRMLKTIAAEGRKFHLFLILISQRPNKINANVISECDNFIIMKSTPATIELLEKQLSLPGYCVQETQRYQTGQALYYGKFTDYEPKRVKGDIRRTK